MEDSDLENLRNTPGFKPILRAIIKSQMKHLVEQLSRHGDEEAILLTATVADASFNHLGSTLTKGFLDSQKDIKKQFLVHCIKGAQEIEENKDQNDKVGPGSKSKSSRKSLNSAKEQSSTTPVSRKRVGGAVSSGTPPKRATISEAVTHTLQAISTETEHEETEESGSSFKVENDKEDPDYDPAENADSSDTLSLDLGTGSKDKHDRMKEFSDTEQSGPRFDLESAKVKVEVDIDYDDKDQSDIDGTAGETEGGEQTSGTGTKTGHKGKKGVGRGRRPKFDPYLICKYCGKTYRRKSGGKQRLQRHEQEHIGEAPDLICKTCGKVYRSESGLQQHERRHAGRTPHKCETCGLGLFGKWNYERHVASHVGIKNHKCSTCGKLFLTEKELKRHLANHDGTHSFKCDLCSRTFEDRRAKKDHMNTHFGVKAYQCKLCPMSYYWLRDIRRHTKKCHPTSMPYSVDDQTVGPTNEPVSDTVDQHTVSPTVGLLPDSVYQES